MSAKDRDSPFGHASRERASTRFPADVWVLLPAALLLAAFLAILPLTRGFRHLAPHERGVYFTALVGAVNGAALFAAPIIGKLIAALRGGRTLPTRSVSRIVIAGRIALALAVILATDVAVNAIGGDAPGMIAALGVAMLIGIGACDTTEERPPGAG